MGGEGLIGLSNEVIGRLGLDGERDGDGGLMLDGRFPIVLDWAKGSEDSSKISECLKRSRRSSGSACSRSGPDLPTASDGMGRVRSVLMSALNSSVSTRIGELGLGEAMRGKLCSAGFVSLVDFWLSEISFEAVCPFGLKPRSPGWGVNCGRNCSPIRQWHSSVGQDGLVHLLMSIWC